MSTVPVVVEHLTKTFGEGRGVIDVSFAVGRGEVVGFLGPNGAGKSTTIRCLLGLYRPTSGRVATWGEDPSRGRAGFLRDTGYLPGELTLPDALTGADLLARFGRMSGLQDVAYRDVLVDRFDADTTHRIGTLSKGNKQKLGLVLAFMHRPHLLVLDEPTSGLDPLLQGEFAALVRETVADGRTVLLSSHDLDEVQRLAGRVIVIRAGRIVADDTVAALRANAPHTMEVDFADDVDAAALGRVPGVHLVRVSSRQVTLTYTGPVAPLLPALAELNPLSLNAHPADLDELFRRLYEPRPREVTHAS